jgi:hypothetical protein
MIDKLKHFLLYLVMVKFEACWKPNMYRRDINRLEDKMHKWSSSEWLNSMFKQSARVYADVDHNCDDEQIEDMFINDHLLNMRVSNPAFPEHYSIWDRVCMEEILALRERLEESCNLSEASARQKSIADTLDFVKETLHKPNEVFDEVLKEALY